MVKLALQKVVANSLAPVSDDEIVARLSLFSIADSIEWRD